MKLSSSVLTAFFVLAFQTGCGKLPPHTGAKEVPFEWPEDPKQIQPRQAQRSKLKQSKSSLNRNLTKQLIT